jgi:hypothetical protein
MMDTVDVQSFLLGLTFVRSYQRRLDASGPPPA